jgi:hypothetical protein
MVGFLKRATGTSGLPNQFDTGPDWDWVSSVGGAIMDTVLFMLKAITQEAAALASLSLFIAMIAIWTQVLGNL